MMKLHYSSRSALNYHDFQDQKVVHVPQVEVSVVSILFDESHGELLQSQSSTASDGIDTWSELDNLLKENLEAVSIVTHTKNSGSITAEILESHQILVLAAPTELFAPEEVEAITQFVLDGNSLLVAASSRSLYEQLNKQVNHDGQDINSLLRPFGLRFKTSLNSPSDEISELYPHFLSSEVSRLFVRESAYLEILPDMWHEFSEPPYIIAKLPHTREPWLATVEPVYRARVAAISDFVVFADDYLIDGNKQLSLNIFRWLAFNNQLDCSASQIKSEIQYGETVTFGISLRNPHGRRLEYISGLLESETGTEILDAEEKNIRSLAPYSDTQFHWTIKPTKLGLQTLKLTIDCLKEPNFMPLFFDIAAQFKCIPDVEFDLVILNHQGEVSDITETGKPIEVKVGLRPKSSVPSELMHFKLTSTSGLVVEALDQSHPHHWRLKTDAAGDYPITLVVGETGQRISRLLRVYPSIQDQISNLEKDAISRLNQEIYYQVAALHCGLDIEEVQKIPFRLYTPEDYIYLLHSGNTAIFDIIQAARRETQENQRLVQLVLKYILPLYSPTHECCCIPYDPQLATHLFEKHPYYQEYLAENFLCLDENNQTYLEQNLAALMLHEKYGHGFFFTQTTLGRQFSILFRHGLHPGADPSKMKSPYPRLLYEEYKTVIQEIWNSAIFLDEGFATWVELTVLPRLPGTMGQGAFRRKVFLFSDAEGRYQRGYEYFQFVHDSFGADAVMKVMLEASDIDIGVTEEGGKVRFVLDAKILAKALQSSTKSTIRADARLEQIHETLYKTSQKAQVKREQVEYIQDKFYPDTLISTLIHESIG